MSLTAAEDLNWRGGEGGQQVPGSATETTLSVSWAQKGKWVWPAKDGVKQRAGALSDSVLHSTSSLWVVSFGQFTFLVCLGEELECLPGEVVSGI